MNKRTQTTVRSVVLPSTLLLVGAMLGWMIRGTMEPAISEEPLMDLAQASHEPEVSTRDLMPVDGHRVVNSEPSEEVGGQSTTSETTDVTSAADEDSQPPPAGTPESKRWWRRKHLSNARQALLEAPPEARVGSANFALCLAIAATLDVLGPSAASELSNEDAKALGFRSFSVLVNGKDYFFTNLEFPEYEEVTAAVVGQKRFLESGGQVVDVVAIDPNLESQVLYRIDQALTLIDE